MKELYKASGGDWGGSSINYKFEEYLKQMFGTRVIERVKKEYPSDWVGIMRDFEQIKRSFSNAEQDESAVLMLKPCLTELYQEIHGITLQKAFQEGKMQRQRGAILRKKTRLQIPSITLMNLIESVSVNVKKFVQELWSKLSETGPMDFVIMVGGFSNSPVLQEEVESVIQTTPLLVPEEAELAVIKGAVIFGWKPETILARRCKYTYGIGTALPFESDTDPASKRIINGDGVPYCNYRFCTLVEEMQAVHIGETITEIFNPQRHEQKEASIPVYHSSKRSVRYTDEPGCEYIGNLIVPMPDTTGGICREIKVFVKFGDTEFRVDAEDLTSGNKVNASFDFLSVMAST